MISAGDADPGSVLILGDSLAFHGPDGAYRPTDPRLFGTRVGQGLGKTVDLVARPGWTTRDIWWALTKDPVVWGVYLPRASHVLLAVGGMDALPAAAPTWVRESISFIRPGALRRRVRSAFLRASPVVIKTSSGRLRQLPQHATDHYLSRIVNGIRTFPAQCGDRHPHPGALSQCPVSVCGATCVSRGRNARVGAGGEGGCDRP